MQIEITELEAIFWADLAEKVRAKIEKRADGLERALLLDLTERFIEKLKNVK